MRVVVTGAGGLIGQHTTRYLADRRVDVIGVERRADSDGVAIDWIVVDLAKVPTTLSLRDMEADAVVHLAAIPGPGVVDDNELIANNVVATANVLEAAARAGIVKVLIASSVSIYGYVWSGKERPPLPNLPLSETSPIYPMDAYAATKEIDEALARMYSRRYRMSILSLRFPNVSGMSDAIARRRVVAADPEEASRELWGYLTLDDAAEAIYRGLQMPFVGSLVANVVSPQSLYPGDVRDIVRTYYPEAKVSLDQGKEQGLYTTEIARGVLGFQARSVIESVD